MREKLIGRWGEAEAAAFLRRRRYEILSMGFRCRFGEIDLIARSGRYIVFVEVKTRKNDRFAAAREYVDAEKRRKLRNTAAIWLANNETELQPRFDVIEVYAKNGAFRNPIINHLEDAF